MQDRCNAGALAGLGKLRSPVTRCQGYGPDTGYAGSALYAVARCVSAVSLFGQPLRAIAVVIGVCQHPNLLSNYNGYSGPAGFRDLCGLGLDPFLANHRIS